MRRPRKFREDDLETWRRVKSSVTPLSLSQERRAEGLPAKSAGDSKSSDAPLPLSSPMPKKSSAAAIQVHLRQRTALEDVQGLHRSTRRAIKKGQMQYEARIDLHGLRLEPARAQFEQFLASSARRGYKVVLVITGKGGHKRTGDFGVEVSGVIRRAFPEWMQERAIAHYVSHYTQAHISHGGEGAWYVFIRSSARQVRK